MREHKFKHSFQNSLNPFLYVALMLKQRSILYFTASYLPIKGAPSWTLLMILIVIWQILILFFISKTSLDISANTLILNAPLNYIISTHKFAESLFSYFAIFCHIFISLSFFHIFFVFMSFFFLRLYIHIHLVLRFDLIYLFTLFFYILFLFIPRCLLIVIFYFICLYVRYS